jgi:RNase H-fold protein (predicted Holliday junction resolvase)
MAANARAFAATLESRYRLIVNLVDERYSSLEAQRGCGTHGRRDCASAASPRPTSTPPRLA